jgi:hypothetical protein
MLHRMTTLLSTVVIAFLAAPVLDAVFSTAARAGDSCLARPTGSSSNGSRWFHQTNPITHQKCWVRGGEETALETTVRKVGLPRLLAFGSSNEVAEKTTAVNCLAAPNGTATQGRHWVYRLDNGRRCWRLADQASRTHASKTRTQVSRTQVSRTEVSRTEVSRTNLSKTGDAIPPRAPVTSVAPKTPAAILPPGIADANARFADPSTTPPSRIESASSPTAGVAETANEIPAAPFDSRWMDLPDHARSSESEPEPVRHSELGQPDPPVSDDVARSTKADATKPSDLRAVERPLDVSLLIFVGSLGGALILFGLASRSFFYARPAPPSHDVFRVAELSSNSPGDGAERRPPPENDWQIAMDALLRLVGGRSADRDSSRAQRHAAGDRRVGDRRRQSEDNGS